MDQLDKNIIAQLMGCSRKSYRSIADSLGVSCPTVKKRVERLRIGGIIQRFSVEMSQETLGTRWVAAEIDTNGSEDKGTLLKKFDEHECIREVLSFGQGQYMLFAEVTPEEKSGCKEYLDSLGDLVSSQVAYVNQIPSKNVGDQCKFAKKGKPVQVTTDQMEVLWHLVKNSRIPAKALSRYTGQTIKHVRRILKEILQNPGIHFTTQLNLVSSGDINFLLSVDCNRITTPGKIADQLSMRFPQEHWFSMNTIERNSLYAYMTAKNLRRVEEIIETTSMNENIYNVDAKIIYSVMKSEGRSERFIRDFAMERIDRVSKDGRRIYSGL